MELSRDIIDMIKVRKKIVDGLLMGGKNNWIELLM